MSTRKLSPLEQKVHRAALAADDRTLSQKEVEALGPDSAARTAALNFLLAAGLLKLLKDSKGKFSYRAVVKKELDVKKDLTDEESLVLSHIQASGNEGIWTKHLKVKTELHQTVIDRCLKSLTQKQLVKAVKGSVQHPTRKMYMLFHLEPSVEVTGGPWYTDKELDTEFIKLLSAACLKFIKDRSFPRSKSGDPTSRILYPISAAPPYPSAGQVQAFLNKSRITETQLTVEHVEMLLNVLVIDGVVEKVPAMGAALWDSNMNDDNAASSSEDERSKSKKRKRMDDTPKKKKKRPKTESSSESDSESDVDDKKRSKSKSSSKKKGKKRSKEIDSEDSGSESESEEEKSRKKRKKSKRRAKEGSSDENGMQDSSEEEVRKKKKSTKRGLQTSSDESDEPKARSRTKIRKRSRSPVLMDVDDDGVLGGGHVYRAIYPERMTSFGASGISQAPCGRCPTFDFCKTGGPVNPGECVYYGEWLGTAEIKLE